jgi:hypothetical protein
MVVRNLPLATVVLGGFALLSTMGGLAEAQNKCAGEKIKAAGKKTTCKTALEAKQASAGGTIDPAKVAKCEAKLSSTFAKNEAKGPCLTTGDAATVEAKIDAFVADLDTELAVGTLPNKCQGEKIKAAGKKAACKLTLEAKQASKGGSIDPAKVAKCEAKLSSAFAKQEAGGACNTTGDAAAIEAKVDAFVADADTETNPPTLPCCPAGRMTILGSPGGFYTEATIAPFAFPGGTQITIEIGSPDGSCKHAAFIPPGGFTAPAFCQPALNFSTRYDASGCEGGSADGNGMVWDGNAPCPDPEVAKVGDTSDGTCNPPGQPCNTMAGGAGNNELGDTDTTRGDTVCDTAGLHAQLNVPVQVTTWLNGDADGCPDPDGVVDGGDIVVVQREFILSPTTDLASAAFVDKNGDTCKRAGFGPDGPLTVTGAPAAGPCCVVGQPLTLVTAGVDLQGGGPIFDVLYTHTSPATVSACSAPGPAQTCTLTTDPCDD